MKKLFIGLVAAALFAVNGTRAHNHPIEILPKPVKIVAFQNAAVLSGADFWFISIRKRT